MADAIIINEPTAEELETQSKLSESQKRIKQLSENVKLTAEERDEKDRLLKESTEKVASLEKENAFSSGFADMLGTYPLAKDHKDDIKTKVLLGYSVEDATIAVLGKAGKFGTQAPAPNVAGGSADTAMSSATKEVKDMSLAEKRAVLDKELVWQ